MPDNSSPHITSLPPASQHEISLTINGKDYRLSVPGRRTLLDLLRDDLHLTGAKKVCDMGHCGACTVLRDGRAILSCLTLAAACERGEFLTIEGLANADGNLTRLQQAFIDCDGFQCGFCTPGQIMSATALLAENPAPTSEEVQAYMSGNLCRCGAYRGIVEAVLQAASSAEAKQGGKGGPAWSE